MEEYVVTVKSGVNLDEFYDDMETLGGCDCIPEREVECSNRRPISRNTEYILTSEEAEVLKNDSRILDVVSKQFLNSLIVKPSWTQTSSDWDKSGISASTNINWGLYRCIRGSQVSNWGSNGTVDQSATITTTSSGKNVDVVIVDGHLDPSHPEFAVNSDGTGGSRVIQYNWYQHTNQLGLGANGFYIYPTGADLLNSEDNHGMHVAGTVAGNTQGWARDANIYNISPYSQRTPNTTAAQYIFDYIRAWHNKKTINPLTGRINPTILNNSWSYFYTVVRSNISSVSYRGTTYSGAPTNTQLQSYGIVDFDSTNVYPLFYGSSLIADIEDAVNDGIIFVAAAANDSTKIDIEGGTDYDNYISATYQGGGPYAFYYHRGSSNSSASRTGVAGGTTTARITLTSSTVSSGADAPESIYSTLSGVTGAANSNPQLSWSVSGLPSGVTVSSYRIHIEDLSTVDKFVHWHLTGIRPSVTSINLGSTSLPEGATKQNTSWPSQTSPYVNTIGYGGPAPPSGKHNYRITISAFLSGSSSVLVKGLEFYAGSGSVVANAATATYQNQSSVVTQTVPGQRLSVCVGAVSSLVNESKATFSNCGPRVDVYAPGVNIISSLHTSGGSTTLVDDSRNSSYKLGKYQGTSMASPQVCGILACLLEQYPSMNQADIHEYLKQHSTKNQMTTTNGGYTDNTDLQNSENSYIFYKQERLETGVSVPRYSYSSRKADTAGVKYPRTNYKVTKN